MLWCVNLNCMVSPVGWVRYTGQTHSGSPEARREHPKHQKRDNEESSKTKTNGKPPVRTAPDSHDKASCSFIFWGEVGRGESYGKLGIGKQEALLCRFLACSRHCRTCYSDVDDQTCPLLCHWPKAVWPHPLQIFRTALQRTRAAITFLFHRGN